MFTNGFILPALVAFFFHSVSSHVIMVEPHPFNLDTDPLYQTSPLGAELPFPCQGHTQHAEAVTKVYAGKTQKVKFWGGAVHGGGSCQFAIHEGHTPSDDVADWKVIYSIIGGCPASAEGNIAEDGADPHGRVKGVDCSKESDTECVREFSIPIPKGMNNGPAIFSWTWFNKIGNREMYMVCAPIEVVDGTEDSAFIDTLPSMFKANVGEECITGNGVLNFPEPGKFGKEFEDATPGSSGACPEGVFPEFDDASGDPGERPAPENSASQEPSSPSTDVVDPPADTQAPVSETPATTEVASDTAPNPTTVITATVPADPTGIVPSEGVPVETSTPGGGADGEPCPMESAGQIICLGPELFGICNQGFAVPQAVAPGTTCIDGVIGNAAK